MTRCVVDTNVFVSGFIKTGTAPGAVLRALTSGALVLVTSPALIDELTGVLTRPRLVRAMTVPPVDVAEFLARVLQAAVVVDPAFTIEAVGRDPADDRVLEAAIAGHAEFIITGDLDLLSLGEFQGVQILTPAEFVATRGLRP